MTSVDHEELVDRILNLEASVLVSGYDHPTYTALDQAGFERIEFDAMSAAANAVGADAYRTEVLWRRARSAAPTLFDVAA